MFLSFLFYQITYFFPTGFSKLQSLPWLKCRLCYSKEHCVSDLCTKKYVELSLFFSLNPIYFSLHC